MRTINDIKGATDFAKEVHRLWRSTDTRVISNRPLEPIPKSAVLQHICTALFQAGLMKDEARVLKFRILVGEPIHDLTAPNTSLLEFREPLPFELDRLVKLAPAADIDRMLIGVQATDPSDASSLRIWGLLADLGSSEQAQHGAVRVNELIRNCLIIACTGPGDLTAMVGSRVILRLRRGSLEVPRSEAYSNKWFSDYFKPLRSSIRSMIRDNRQRSPNMFRRVLPGVVEGVIQLALKGLVAELRKRGHGGALYFSSRKRLTDLVHSELLAVGYQPERVEAWTVNKSLSIGRAIWSLFYSAPQLGLAFPPFKFDSERRKELLGKGYEWWDLVNDVDVTPRWGVFHANESLSLTIRAVGSLSQVDGIVAFDERLDVFGFGCFVRDIDAGRGASVLKTSAVEGESMARVPVHSIGTRHRSMISLIRKAGGLGVVVSQDGSAKIIRRSRYGVEVHENVGTDLLTR